MSTIIIFILLDLYALSIYISYSAYRWEYNHNKELRYLLHIIHKPKALMWILALLPLLNIYIAATCITEHIRGWVLRTRTKELLLKIGDRHPEEPGLNTYIHKIIGFIEHEPIINS